VVSVNQNDIELLKSRIDQRVLFHCKDGEQIVGKVILVSDEDQDVIYDMVSSNRNERYASFGDAAHLLKFEEIDFVALPDTR
jgi:hypothetical protein